MARYWLYLDSKVLGPYEVSHLRKVPGFTLLSQVCAEGEQAWRVADEVIDIKSYFLAPPRASSIMLDSGNAVAVPQPLPEEVTTLLSVIEPEKEAPGSATPAAMAQGLRLFCEICGYKNPRDVA